jgi:hypothetical protein
MHSTVSLNRWNFDGWSKAAMPTGGPQLDLLRPPPSHRFGSIGESFNIFLKLLVKFKHIGLNAVVFSRFVNDSVWGGGGNTRWPLF